MREIGRVERAVMRAYRELVLSSAHSFDSAPGKFYLIDVWPPEYVEAMRKKSALLDCLKFIPSNGVHLKKEDE